MIATSKGRPSCIAGIGCTIASAVYISLSSLSFAESDNRSLRPEDPKIVRLGNSIYVEQCASCHGKNLEGEANWKRPNKDGLLPAPPHDETGHTWHHADSLLFDLTKYGLAKTAGLKNYKTNMPVFEGVLTDEEIIAVLSFIKSRWPEDVRARHDQLNLAVEGK